MMKSILHLFVVFAILGLSQCGQVAPLHLGEKITGVSFVAPVRPIDSTALVPVKQINANWVCLMPYAFTPRDSDELIFNLTGQWWGENVQGVGGCVALAHQRGIKVMIKPHIWLRHGGFTGTFDLPNDEAWKKWETNYSRYILTYAKVADSLHADLFCIGTELENFAQKRSDFWKNLITQVKGIYKGKITYAANWDTFQKFPHWQDLDYVGIDAYFPLSESATPTAAELKKGWEKHHEILNEFVANTQKPILFTEYGYRSIDQTAKEPWVSDTPAKVNHQAQANAYEALFAEFWHEPWFAGGFAWKWYEPAMLNRAESRWHKIDTDFTPQNKAAEQVMQKWYGKK